MNPDKKQYYAPVTAVLGPTNTGKTHDAIEAMLTHQSGVIGFPLRLLARENYDKLVARLGRTRVALVTGEEKIIPNRAQYYMCTVEAMPVAARFDFAAVDEIQLCGDPERGHIFTDRLLRARGVQQTMFLGSDTMRFVLKYFVPNIEIMDKQRLSELNYTGFCKLTRLPRRSAIVAFSMEEIYRLAEFVRRHRGGAAIVLGALSPRTRNAQVEMYQNGEVDYLIATDAIGMGLNMDIRHIALAGTRKYDGIRMRELQTTEIAQIAGRAGRYTRDGTFGVTGNIGDIDPLVADAIQAHRFPQLEGIYWRNAELNFNSPKALLNSLDSPPQDERLIKGREAHDVATLRRLIYADAVMARVDTPDMVRLLWEVCQIPDFRKTMSDTHQALVADIFCQLLDNDGLLPEAQIHKRIARLDDTSGDVDTLMSRLAHIRTWTYITHKSEWLANPAYWQDYARAIEDRLSDALHEGLSLRFVDKRSAALMRSMHQGGELLAGIRGNGEVIVEGHYVGRLEGFRFAPDPGIKDKDNKQVMGAARAALGRTIRERRTMLENAHDTQFGLDESGTITWQRQLNNPLPGEAVARLRAGDAPLNPAIEVLADDDMLDITDRNSVHDRLRIWLERYIADRLAPLKALEQFDELPAEARGIAYQLHENLGVMRRADLEDMIAQLDETARAALRPKRIRFGPVHVYQPALIKPAPARLRAMLWALYHGYGLPVTLPHDGAASTALDQSGVDHAFYLMIGYPVYGGRAVRVDMLDRLVGAIYDVAEKGQFTARHEWAEWLGCSIPELYAVIADLGHQKSHDPAEQQGESDDKSDQGGQAEARDTQQPAEEGDQAGTEQSAAPGGKALQSGSNYAERPELATFRLNPGKAHKTAHKKAGADKKPGKGKSQKGAPQKGKGKAQNDKGKQQSEAPATQSPFAVLEQLKDKQ
jgi:ATP-dependent RNA helicase SUPV3L1/SUV3